MIDRSFLSLGMWGRWMMLTVVGFIVSGFIGTGVGFVAVPLVSILLAFLLLILVGFEYQVF